MRAPVGAQTSLRRMRWWDIAPAADLERLLFPEDAWSPEMFWSELAQPGSRHYLVAEDADGRVVGYAGLFVSVDDADIQTLAVHPSHWGRGIGAALLEALIGQAARRGCRSMFLEVRVDNERAQGLYRRFGFSPLGVRRAYYQPSGVDALVMRLDGLEQRAVAGA